MQIILQRMTKGSLIQESAINIEKGYVLFVKRDYTDVEKTELSVVDKILKLRLWNDWKSNLLDLGYCILIVDSEYPSTNLEKLFIEKLGVGKVKRIKSDNLSKLEFINDGPCTIILNF